MAQGRILQRAIATSRKVAALKNNDHRLLYTWLIPFLDVEGRCEADPRLIKGYVVPLIDDFTIKKIEAALADMVNVGLITIYRDIDGADYLQLNKFRENQPNLRKEREAPSKIPSPQQVNQNHQSNHKDGVTPELVQRDDGVAQELVPHKYNISKYKSNIREYNIIAQSQNCDSDSEPQRDSENVFIEIPIVGKKNKEHPVTMDDVRELQDLFPGIDVRAELRKLKAWNLANPTKRKTAAGIRRHIAAWLTKAQDKAGGKVQHYEGEYNRLREWLQQTKDDDTLIKNESLQDVVKKGVLQ